MKTLKNFKRKIQYATLAGLLLLAGCGGGGNSVTPQTAATTIDQTTETTTIGSSNPVTPQPTEWPPKEIIIAQKNISELPAVVDYKEAEREFCENKYGLLTHIPPIITKDIVDSVDSLIKDVGGTFLANVDPKLDIVLIDNTDKLMRGIGAFTGDKIVMDYKTSHLTYGYFETLAHELGHSVDNAPKGSEFISQFMSVASAFVIETEHPWYLHCSKYDSIESYDSIINESLRHLFTDLANGRSIYRAGAISTAMILNDYNGNFREAIKALANPDIFNYYFTSGNKLQGGYYSVIKEGAVIDGVVNNIAEIKCSGLKKLLKNNTNDTTLKEAKAQEIYSGYGFKYEVEKNVYEITSCNLFIIPYSDSPAERVISNDSLENGLDEIVVGQESYPQ